MKPKKFVPIFFWIVACLTILGTILRFTIRDAYWGAATLFYMTPLSLLVVGAGVMLSRQVYLHEKKLARLWAGLLVVLFCWWITVDWQRHAQLVEHSDDFVIVLANIARNDHYDELRQLIEQHKPTVVGLIEALSLTEEQRQHWESFLPDYEWSMIGGGTQLFAKGPISSPWVKALEDGSRISRSVITLNGQEIHCFVVDIASTLHRSRKLPLQTLTEFVKESNAHPTIIMGDFNLPADSVHFTKLRDNFNNLFEEVGNGYAATWPQPVPVLTLDQIWISKSLEPVSCQLLSTPNTDHRMLVGRFRIPN